MGTDQWTWIRQTATSQRKFLFPVTRYWRKNCFKYEITTVLVLGKHSAEVWSITWSRCVSPSSSKWILGQPENTREIGSEFVQLSLPSSCDVLTCFDAAAEQKRFRIEFGRLSFQKCNLFSEQKKMCWKQGPYYLFCSEDNSPHCGSHSCDVFQAHLSNGDGAQPKPFSICPKSWWVHCWLKVLRADIRAAKKTSAFCYFGD